MTLFVAAAAKTGSPAFPHYSLYALLVVIGGVLLWAARQFFGSLISSFGGKSADAIAAGFARRGRIAGGRLRKYRRAIQRDYAGHALGFGGTESIDIRAVYVPLNYEDSDRHEDIYARIRGERRSVVVGPAGAGKSLLLKHSMLIWADDSRPGAWRRDDRRVPVLVELHRCNDIDADVVQLVVDELSRNQVRRPRSFVDRALRDGCLRLLFDGLDEVGRDRRERVIAMIKDFARANPDCQIVLTCRDAVYHGQLTPVFQHVVRIAEFDDASIRRLLGNWPGISRADLDNLVGALHASPQLMHLARSPLLLTMIAYLYVGKFAKSGRSLPSSRVTFYATAITHLLDRDQALARAESLSAFDTGDKLAALRRIALAMQGSAVGGADRKEISQVAAIAATRSVLPDLNLDDNKAKPLLTEIIDRSQLLIPLDQQRSRYAFPHLTLQEYLAARELANRPDDLLRGYQADPDGWREVVKLWCGVARQNTTAVVREVLAFGSPRHQVLALECLAEAKYLDDAFAREVIDYFTGMLSVAGETTTFLIAGFGALAASDSPRGRDLLRRLGKLAAPASSAGEEGRRAAIDILCASGRQEAADILISLAARDETARAALRTMGDLVIPGLAQQAAAGNLHAVDDLAFIGTPAAAEALAGLLGGVADAEVAFAAAWRLAELLTVPDVEEGLKNSSFQVPDGVGGYEWVWQPFASSAARDEPIGWIIGRAAFLIDHYPHTAPAGVRDIDQRIALPLAAMAVGKRVKANGTAVLARTVKKTETETRDYFLAQSRSQSPATKKAAKRADSVIRALKLPSSHECLVRLLLPPPVCMRLLAAAFNPRIKTTGPRDWNEIRQEPSRKLWWWHSLYSYGILTISSLASLIFGSIEESKAIHGSSHLIPWWACAAILIILASSAIILYGAFIASATMYGIPEFVGECIFYVCVSGLAVSLVADTVVSVLALGSWYGLDLVAPLTGVFIAVMFLLGWWSERNEGRWGNPLRQCYAASGNSFADRTSVIAS